MTRLSRSFTATAAMLALFAGAAQAVPPVLDKVPAEAALVVAIPSVDGLEKDLRTVAQWVGFPLPFGVDQALASMGIEGGVNRTGSMALVLVDAPDMEAGGPPNIFMLIPTSDYGALIKGLGGTAGGAVDTVTVDGVEAFARSLGGGYAAISPVKETIEKLSADGGHTAKHKAFIGDAGDKLADSSDIVFIINGAKMRPLVKEGVREAMQNMKDQMAGMGGEAGLNTAAAEWLVNMVVNDTRAVVAGANIDGVGVSLDSVLAFNEGSKLAAVTSAGGNSAKLMSRLPAQPYLLSMSIDLAHAGLKKFIADMPKPAEPQPGSMDLPFLAEKTDGLATMVGYAPGGIMAGLFSKAVTFTATSDPAAFIAETKKAMEEMKKAGVGEGTYSEGAAEVAGTKVDTWEVRMSADADNPMAAQVMMLMFGAAGGPNGYTAKVPGGVIQTMSKSSDLMAAALAASKGESSLATDKLTQQVSDKLPKGRVAESYIGFKAILDSVIPLMTQFGGMQIKYETPQSLPPVGVALAPSGGSIQATLYVPAPVIKTTSEFVRAIYSAGGARGGDPGDDAPPAKDSGQPKF